MSDVHRTAGLRAAVLLAAACLSSSPAFADGCYFSRVESVAVSSDQRALMIRNGDETSLTLSTAYAGEAEDFAWVIPTPVPLSADGLRETGEKAEGIFRLLDTWTSPSVVKESGCFPAGTGVLTPDGLRPIETVEPGARVLSYDPATGLWVTAAVLERQSRQYGGDVVAIRLDTAFVRATGNHPFLVLRGAGLARRPAPEDVPPGEQNALPRGRWVAARDLRPGDMLADRSGQGALVTGVAAVREELPVYNLSAAGAHTYAVLGAGLVVHNKAGAERTDRVTVHARVITEHYEGDVLGALDGSALLAYLAANGYRVSPSARVVLDDYIRRGWSFVTLKLRPGAGRRSEGEFLPAITLRYGSPTFAFPLLISSVSTAGPARLTLYVIAESTVISSNLRTRPLRYNHEDLQASPDPAAYIRERISRTVGKRGRALAVMWNGRLPDSPQVAAAFTEAGLQPPSNPSLTRLETVVTPSAMSRDILLRLEPRPDEFSVQGGFRADWFLIGFAIMVAAALASVPVSAAFSVALGCLSFAGSLLVLPGALVVLLRGLRPDSSGTSGSEPGSPPASRSQSP
jgi:hypothetical protein